MCVNNDNYEDHIKSLRDFFHRIKEADLTVKPSKIEIGFQEISFLGHNVSQGNIGTEEIISKILNVQIPTTKKHVRSFIGLMNYYSKFIEGFAEKKKAIFSSLLKKNSPSKIVWTEQLNKTFIEIKELFSRTPILKLPNCKLPIVVQTDASGIAIAGCLLQPYDNILRPVLYICRKLNDTKRNYSMIEKEVLAIIYSILKLKKFLIGRKFFNPYG